jgi:hypothetical protein
MKRPEITMQVIKEDTGYSAYAMVDNISINTCGDTFDELKLMVVDAVNLSFEDKGYVYTMDEIKFTYDLSSFFEFYKIINASALSKRIHMPQSLLAQYITGKKKPSKAQTQRILKGVQEVGRELSEISFLL